MNLERRSIQLGKIVRHEPSCINTTADRYGWVMVNDILRGMKITFKQLEDIVAHGDKVRYIINEDKSKVRALHGHTFPIDTLLTNTKPPKILYHGTLEETKEIIYREGISKMNRNHVHLSTDTKLATRVAKRRKKPIYIIQIRAKDMHEDGFELLLAENGTWLTDYVPSKYLI